MTQKPKILIVAPYMDQQAAYNRLSEAGFSVVQGRLYEKFRAQAYSEEELIPLCKDVEAIMGSNRERLTRPVLEAAQRLKLVVYPFTGVDRVDIVAATQLGILVCNSTSKEIVAGMAEATIGLILTLAKRIKHSENILRGGQWGGGEDRGDLILGKTIGLIGLGRIGGAVASLFGSWGVRILAYDPYVDPAVPKNLDVEMVKMDTLLQEADFVSIHVVLTPETTNLLGEREFQKMKPTSYVINTSRGEVIDENALARAVEEGWINGCALDSFWNEPLPSDSKLRQLDHERVILTPHKIGHTKAASIGNHQLAIESILKGLRGEIPDSVVNRDAIEKWNDRLA